ncbi:phage tail protein [Oceanimonas smirnovii]|uniref:phage tail protein n=1 Tax=Oceanimonas smirnovii TaxID=264574 RepID=UPI00036A6B32|nr:phage tail protein [Oceanimonas smirnovii]
MSLDKDLARAVNNLASVSTKAVPKAGAMAANRVAGRARSQAVRLTAKEVKVPAKKLRPRVRVNKATARLPIALIRVRRADMPLISVAPVQQRLIRYRRSAFVGIGDLQVGRHRVPGGFIADGSKGKGPYIKGRGYGATRLKRAQILTRTGKARYPVKVEKIPLKVPLTRHFNAVTKKLMATDMPKELRQALARQLQLYVAKQ